VKQIKSVFLCGLMNDRPIQHIIYKDNHIPAKIDNYV
jgi:hypothetical protein